MTITDTTTTVSETITLTFTRGRLIIESHDGFKGYGVESDGPIRGRELMWCERPDGSHRVIPATAWRDFTGARD